MVRLQVILVPPSCLVSAQQPSQFANASQHNVSAILANSSTFYNSALPYEDTTRKFLHITKNDNTLQQVSDEIIERFFKLYPTDETLDINRLQDGYGLDLDPEYLVRDVFEELQQQPPQPHVIKVILNNELSSIDPEYKSMRFNGSTSNMILDNIENSQEEEQAQPGQSNGHNQKQQQSQQLQQKNVSQNDNGDQNEQEDNFEDRLPAIKPLFKSKNKRRYTMAAQDFFDDHTKLDSKRRRSSSIWSRNVQRKPSKFTSGLLANNANNSSFNATNLGHSTPLGNNSRHIIAHTQSGNDSQSQSISVVKPRSTLGKQQRGSSLRKSFISTNTDNDEASEANITFSPPSDHGSGIIDPKKSKSATSNDFSDDDERGIIHSPSSKRITSGMLKVPLKRQSGAFHEGNGSTITADDKYTADQSTAKGSEARSQGGIRSGFETDDESNDTASKSDNTKPKNTMENAVDSTAEDQLIAKKLIVEKPQNGENQIKANGSKITANVAKEPSSVASKSSAIKQPIAPSKPQVNGKSAEKKSVEAQPANKQPVKAKGAAAKSTQGFSHPKVTQTASGTVTKLDNGFTMFQSSNPSTPPVFTQPLDFAALVKTTRSKNPEPLIKQFEAAIEKHPENRQPIVSLVPCDFCFSRRRTCSRHYPTCFRCYIGNSSSECVYDAVRFDATLQNVLNRLKRSVSREGSLETSSPKNASASKVTPPSSAGSVASNKNGTKLTAEDKKKLKTTVNKLKENVKSPAVSTPPAKNRLEEVELVSSKNEQNTPQSVQSQSTPESLKRKNAELNNGKSIGASKDSENGNGTAISETPSTNNEERDNVAIKNEEIVFTVIPIGKSKKRKLLQQSQTQHPTNDDSDDNEPSLSKQEVMKMFTNGMRIPASLRQSRKPATSKFDLCVPRGTRAAAQKATALISRMSSKDFTVKFSNGTQKDLSEDEVSDSPPANISKRSIMKQSVVNPNQTYDSFKLSFGNDISNVGNPSSNKISTENSDADDILDGNDSSDGSSNSEKENEDNEESDGIQSTQPFYSSQVKLENSNALDARYKTLEDQQRLALLSSRNSTKSSSGNDSAKDQPQGELSSKPQSEPQLPVETPKAAAQKKKSAQEQLLEKQSKRNQLLHKAKLDKQIREHEAMNRSERNLSKAINDSLESLNVAAGFNFSNDTNNDILADLSNPDKGENKTPSSPADIYTQIERSRQQLFNRSKQRKSLSPTKLFEIKRQIHEIRGRANEEEGNDNELKLLRKDSEKELKFPEEKHKGLLDPSASKGKKAGVAVDQKASERISVEKKHVQKDAPKSSTDKEADISNSELDSDDSDSDSDSNSDSDSDSGSGESGSDPNSDSESNPESTDVESAKAEKRDISAGNKSVPGTGFVSKENKVEQTKKAELPEQVVKQAEITAVESNKAEQDDDSGSSSESESDSSSGEEDSDASSSEDESDNTDSGAEAEQGNDTVIKDAPEPAASSTKEPVAGKVEKSAKTEPVKKQLVKAETTKENSGDGSSSRDNSFSEESSDEENSDDGSDDGSDEKPVASEAETKKPKANVTFKTDVRELASTEDSDSESSSESDSEEEGATSNKNGQSESDSDSDSDDSSSNESDDDDKEPANETTEIIADEKVLPTQSSEIEGSQAPIAASTQAPEPTVTTAAQNESSDDSESSSSEDENDESSDKKTKDTDTTDDESSDDSDSDSSDDDDDDDDYDYDNAGKQSNNILDHSIADAERQKDHEKNENFVSTQDKTLADGQANQQGHSDDGSFTDAKSDFETNREPEKEERSGIFSSFNLAHKFGFEGKLGLRTLDTLSTFGVPDVYEKPTSSKSAPVLQRSPSRNLSSPARRTLGSGGSDDALSSSSSDDEDDDDDDSDSGNEKKKGSDDDSDNDSDSDNDDDDSEDNVSGTFLSKKQASKFKEKVPTKGSKRGFRSLFS